MTTIRSGSSYISSPKRVQLHRERGNTPVSQPISSQNEGYGVRCGADHKSMTLRSSWVCLVWRWRGGERIKGPIADPGSARLAAVLGTLALLEAPPGSSMRNTTSGAVGTEPPGATKSPPGGGCSSGAVPWFSVAGPWQTCPACARRSRGRFASVGCPGGMGICCSRLPWTRDCPVCFRADSD